MEVEGGQLAARQMVLEETKEESGEECRQPLCCHLSSIRERGLSEHLYASLQMRYRYRNRPHTRCLPRQQLLRVVGEASRKCSIYLVRFQAVVEVPHGLGLGWSGPIQGLVEAVCLLVSPPSKQSVVMLARLVRDGLELVVENEPPQHWLEYHGLELGEGRL